MTTEDQINAQALTIEQLRAQVARKERDNAELRRIMDKQQTIIDNLRRQAADPGRLFK